MAAFTWELPRSDMAPGLTIPPVPPGPEEPPEPPIPVPDPPWEPPLHPPSEPPLPEPAPASTPEPPTFSQCGRRRTWLSGWRGPGGCHPRRGGRPPASQRPAGRQLPAARRPRSGRTPPPTPRAGRPRAPPRLPGRRPRKRTGPRPFLTHEDADTRPLWTDASAQVASSTHNRLRPYDAADGDEPGPQGCHCPVPVTRVEVNRAVGPGKHLTSRRDGGTLRLPPRPWPQLNLDVRLIV